MQEISVWQEALISSWYQVWSSLLNIIPTLLGAIIVFAVGLVVAYWAKRLVIEVLKLVRVGELAKGAGIESFLRKAEVKLDLTTLMGTIVEWIVILVFFLAVVDILGLSVVSQVLSQVLDYIPNIIAAALILGAGFFVANLVEKLVRGAFATVDLDAAGPIAKVVRWLVIVITFFSALDQLQVAQSLISTFFQGLTYTIVLVVGLSVGLGAKDLVAKILNDWYEKVRK